MLKILLLGPPAIEYDDQPLKIQRRQIRALIFFLACHPAGVGRDELISIFWPDKDEGSGRKQLRELLSKLRSQLPETNILLTDSDRIRLNTGLVYSDVFDYRLVVQPVLHYFGHSTVKTILPDALVAHLEQSVGLWRSPNFWEGGRFGLSRELDNWFVETAASMELNLIQNLERLAYHYAALTEYDRAIFYTQNALKTDPQNEELQEKLLSWFYKAGRISEAKSFYAYLTNLYQREDEENPFDSLIPTISPDREKEAREQVKFENDWPINTPVTSHFVGRKQEIEELKRRFTRGDVVLLLGETGLGKTRLVQQFYKSLENKPRLLLATCRPLESELPLQPFVDLIRNYIREEDWDALQPQWQQALSVLVPGVFKTPSSSFSTLSTTAGQAQSSLFESIRQLLLSISKTTRILFVLDDAHWSDLVTIRALNYLLDRNFFLDHGLCIVTSRPVINNPAVREWWQTQGQKREFNRIQIPILAREETLELVRHAIGQKPSDQFINSIQNATNGNPLFILEIIHSLLASNIDPASIQDQAEFPLPGSVTTILLEKERECSPASRKILAIAAICGLEFDMEVLEIVSDMSEPELVQCLEELEGQRLIQPVLQSNRPGRFSFVHSFIPEAIISRLSHSRQCLLHNQVATAMAASQNHASNQQAGIIARHFEEAGRPLPAFRNWLKAGQYARGLFAIQEANAALWNAHRISSSIESALSEKEIYNLYAEWGDLSFTVMDIGTLMECYSAMYAAGEQKSSLLLRGAGLSGIAIATALQFEVEKSLAIFEESNQILNQTQHTFEKINTYNRMGFALWLAQKFEKANEMFETAINLGKGDSNGDVRQAVTRSQYQLSISFTLLGWPLKAIKAGNDSLKNAYLLLSSPERQAEAHQALALATFLTGEYEESAEHCKKSLQILEPVQGQRTSTQVFILQARIALMNGQFNKTWDLALKTLKISEENGFVENSAEAHCVMGDLFRVLRDYPKAIQEYTAGSEKNPEAYSRLNCYYRLGYVIAKNGQVEEGMRILDEAIAFAAEPGFKYLMLCAQIFKAMLLAERGSPEESEKLFDQVEKEANARGIKSPSNVRKFHKATLQLNNGNIKDIENCLEKVHLKPDKYPAFWFTLLRYQFENKSQSLKKDNSIEQKDLERFLDEMGKDINTPEIQDLFGEFRRQIEEEITIS